MSKVASINTPQLVNGATYGAAAEDTTVSTRTPRTFTGSTTIDCTDSTRTDGTTKLLVMGEIIINTHKAERCRKRHFNHHHAAF